MLSENINQDIKTAVKKGDAFQAGVLRLMTAIFKNREIEKRGKGGQSELSDEEIIEILSREIKKRKEAVNIYSGAGRNDLADKELKEISIIKNYLPVQADNKEIEKIVLEAVETTGAVSQKDFGRAMAVAVKKLKGRADSVLIAELIKKKLG